MTDETVPVPVPPEEVPPPVSEDAPESVEAATTDMVTDPATADVPTLFGLPMNRVVGFAGPYISVLAGIIATWLTTNVHLFSTFHVGDSDIANALTDIFVFGITALVTWAGQHKWLTGYQNWAYTNQAAAQPILDAISLPVGPKMVAASQNTGVYDAEAEAAALEKLDQGMEPMPEGAIGGKPEASA